MNALKHRRRVIAALAIGFTAVPAAALAATDAVPGDPLKLGQSQRITDASTVLQGSGQKADGVLQVRREGSGIGAVLKVVNATGGAAQRGIDITVPAGQPPLAINADAGKASNLNADELDGRDEEDFLPTRLYGNGTKTLVQGQGGGKSVLLTALNGLECDEGDIALNAGFRSIDPPGDDVSGLVSMEPFRESYTIELRDTGAPSKYRANIICMDNARPFR
jgi:hypothetical protein